VEIFLNRFLSIAVFGQAVSVALLKAGVYYEKPCNRDAAIRGRLK
jgi:hypothetical protein